MAESEKQGEVEVTTVSEEVPSEKKNDNENVVEKAVDDDHKMSENKTEDIEMAEASTLNEEEAKKEEGSGVGGERGAETEVEGEEQDKKKDALNGEFTVHKRETHGQNDLVKDGEDKEKTDADAEGDKPVEKSKMSEEENVKDEEKGDVLKEDEEESKVLKDENVKDETHVEKQVMEVEEEREFVKEDENAGGKKVLIKEDEKMRGSEERDEGIEGNRESTEEDKEVEQKRDPSKHAELMGKGESTKATEEFEEKRESTKLDEEVEEKSEVINGKEEVKENIEDTKGKEDVKENGDLEKEVVMKEKISEGEEKIVDTKESKEVAEEITEEKEKGKKKRNLKAEDKDGGSPKKGSDKTPKTSSADRPVRERKTVERLVETVEKWSSSDFPIAKGRGTPIKDIPSVARKLSRRKPDDIKLLHMLLFGRRGKAVDYKSHILQFSGFSWHENEDKERAKLKEKLDKYVKEKLFDLCDLFNVPDSKPSSRKEDLVAKLIDFLAAPHSKIDSKAVQNQQLSKSVKRKRSARSSPGNLSEKKRSKTSETSRSGRGKAGSDEDDHDDEDGHHQENDDIHHKNEESVQSESEEEHRPKSDSDSDDYSKKMTPKKQRSAASKKTRSRSGDSKERGSSWKKNDEIVTPKKISSPKSSAKKSSGKNTGKGSANSAKAKNSSPSEKELKDKICEILKEVDFNTATFTDILKKLSTYYKKDLTGRKALIKLMIQEELTRLADEADGEEEEEVNAEQKRPASKRMKRAKNREPMSFGRES